MGHHATLLARIPDNWGRKIYIWDTLPPERLVLNHHLKSGDTGIGEGTDKTKSQLKGFCIAIDHVAIQVVVKTRIIDYVQSQAVTKVLN